jgi:hypothetical protein
VNGNQFDNSAFHSGAAYVFVRNGANWAQQAYLKASNTAEGRDFGHSVAVSGDTVAIGSDGESSHAVGVNGNQINDCSALLPTNCAIGSGAAYVFIRSGNTWSQQAYLKASNTDEHDSFGLSIAYSSGTVAVGANGEDSNATGVNGNQVNNSATNSGAAYVFVGVGTIPRPRLNLTSDGGGGYFVRILGSFGQTYRLERATAISGPWSATATNTAPVSGLIEYHEATPPPGKAFYRALTP